MVRVTRLRQFWICYETRPNWARKVRELILFNVLCTVYCGRSCLSLELGKKKNRHRRNKSAGRLQDFDRFGSSRNEIMDITTDINGNGNKLPEIAGSKGTTKAAQSFVLMPVGANRKKLR